MITGHEVHVQELWKEGYVLVHTEANKPCILIQTCSCR
jgi:hypothetical protein